jgi:uncharacterized protein (TIGR03435 family)
MRHLFRLALVVFAALVVVVLLSAVTLQLTPRASSKWTEFSIGPASGQSAWIGPTGLRSDGVLLKVALATAYDIPAVRVIGPPWLSTTRYAINAVVGPDETDVFRPLLQEELKRRLQLQTHIESRPFDVFVLKTAGTPRLDSSGGGGTSIQIRTRETQMRYASMKDVAGALQSILGTPVIDETGVDGFYDLAFGWGDDRVATVTATLRERLGLQLTKDQRDLEVLVVEGIRRDASMFLQAQAGRITRGAPAVVREGVAKLLRTH